MMFINIDQVPQYLQKGSFFEALDPNDFEQFGVPSDCLKADPSIRFDDDLKHFLRSVRFWGVLKMPNEVLSFVMKTKTTLSALLLSEFPEFEDHLAKINALRASQPRESVFLAIQQRMGVRVVQFLHEEMSLPLFPECWYAAACVDDVASMLYLQVNRIPKACCAVLETAATHGSIKVLRYAHNDGLEISSHILDTAAYFGKIVCVKCLHGECGVPYTSVTMLKASKVGNIDLVGYLHETGCPWDEEVCASFAETDRLECLAFAHEKGCPWDVRTCRSAASQGYLRCMEYALLHGCPCDKSVIICALQRGHRNCAHLAYESGCPMPGDCILDNMMLAGGCLLLAEASVQLGAGLGVKLSGFKIGALSGAVHCVIKNFEPQLIRHLHLSEHQIHTVFTVWYTATLLCVLSTSFELTYKALLLLWQISGTEPKFCLLIFIVVLVGVAMVLRVTVLLVRDCLVEIL